MSFGSRLKERREAVGLKQKELGALLGVSGNAIGNYEKGLSSPNADALYKVFEILKCDANYLYQDEMREFGTIQTTQPQGDPAADVPPLDESEELDRQFSVLWQSLDERGKTALAGILEIAARKSRVRVGGP